MSETPDSPSSDTATPSETPALPFASAPAPLAAALAARGFTDLTPVQAAVLNAPAGRDLLVSARTGSGKTVAFGLRIGPLVLEAQNTKGRPRALVVCPTRELALQVAKELQWLFANQRVVACVGGMDPRRESMSLGAGAEIVVGTPGRLCDHINRKNLRLDALRAVVLDEADEMLDMGFRDELEVILQACPTERQTLLFSATFPPLAVALAEQYTREPARLALADAKQQHADIQWVAMLHAQREREAVVVNVLRHYDARSALVFCHTRETVHRIHATLSERGFSAVVLSGDLGQAERSRALAAVRDGRARVLVATNVAARGIDLPSLDLVIHADLPGDVESFTHRSGRTGRAGRKGVAVVLVAASRRRAADRLFQEARVVMERMMPPRPEAIRVADEGRLVQSVLAGLGETSEDDVKLAEKLLTEHSPAALVASLVASYRQKLPEPEELPETFALGRAEPGARPQRPGPDAPARFAPAGEQRSFQQPDRGFERPGRFERPEPAGRFERPDARQDARQDDRRPAGRFERPDPMNRFEPRGAPRQEEPRAAEGGFRSPVRPRPGQERDRPQGRGGAAMFKVNRGYVHNAQPFWLVPLFCRRGRIEREAIGRIEIRERETWFEIHPEAADAFQQSAAQPDKKEPGVRFDRVE
jgi:ATP-dependent RNA helicase DeaD